MQGSAQHPRPGWANRADEVAHPTPATDRPAEMTANVPLVPARMVNEYQYCPRLAYLEWVQGEWADSADTVEGRYAHRRVNRDGGTLPAPGNGTEKLQARSITLSSERLGLIARMDLIESKLGRVTPVDYKRGKRPHVKGGAYDPERVQLCAQGLLLREHGYRCDDGVLYFVASRERVRVAFDADLITATRRALEGIREMARGTIPAPLDDSPKCPRCSLVSICLPDEINHLAVTKHSETGLRPIAVPGTDALPLYVQTRGAKVAKSGETLVVSVNDEKVATARLADTSQVVLMGAIYVTTPCLQELMWRGIPVTWHSYGGWFYGHTIGNGHKNVELRTAQYRASFDRAVCLRFAQGIVSAKIANCRTLLRRNWKHPEVDRDVMIDLKEDARHVRRVRSLDVLLGVEGTAAARYFRRFSAMISENGQAQALAFDFEKRNRRPPTDPINALLSFAYALLTRAWTVTLTAIGFDAFRGLYHQPRYGRPALALDLMEPFRPLIADSVVLQTVNNGEIRYDDFRAVAGSVALGPAGRRRFIAAFERRLSHEVRHPLFGYRVSYRRLMEMQARLLGRFLLGEIPAYPNFTTR